jgi:predicted transcriptional regulator
LLLNASRVCNPVAEALKKKEMDPKFKAVSSEFRRFLIGFLYVYGPMFESDIRGNVKINSSALAYHLKILVEAGLVGNEFVGREGKKFSRYHITEEGVKFLDFLGAKQKLKRLTHKGAPT